MWRQYDDESALVQQGATAEPHRSTTPDLVTEAMPWALFSPSSDCRHCAGHYGSTFVGPASPLARLRAASRARSRLSVLPAVSAVEAPAPAARIACSSPVDTRCSSL